MSTRFGALVAALAFSWACVPSAQAAVRHAVPTGGAAAGACDAGAPCTLTAAFAAAATADEVRLASGTYDAPATLTLTASQAVVAPEPGAPTRPVILDSNATSAKVLLIDADDVTLRGLRVEGTSTAATDDLVAFAGTRSGGQVEAMEIVQLGTAPGLTGIGLTVRDSLVVNRSTSGVAGLMTGMTIGSTFIADLSNGIALEISTARFPSYGQLIVRNAILRGGSSSGGRDFRVTDDDGFGPKAAAGDVDFSNLRSGRSQGPIGGGLVLGTNNVTASPPLLVNLSGGLDVHQQDGSPTIGVGSLADASTSPTDWEGDPRVIGDLPDMGADEAALAPLLAGTSVGTITATGATVSGDVTPNGLATTYRVEYGTTTGYGSATAWTAAGSGGTAVSVAVPLTGLSSSTTYHARLVVQNAKGTVPGPDLPFTTAAPTTQPTVTGSTAGSLTASGATVSASVGPNGAASEYRVEYGPTASYGSATAWTSAGSGLTPVPVGVALTGLASSTTYHARLVARNAGGTTNGPDLTFTTADLPPTVLGSGAGAVTAAGATISATVNPNRVATTYLVEYGTTLAYGSSTASASAGSGALDVAVSVPLTGLTSSTLYHARVVATSAGGTTYGPDLTFTTSPLPPSVTGTSAGSVTTSGATIAGSVNPNRVATTYWVEYGTSVAYGSQTTAVSAGSGSSAVAASVPLSGLTSSTTYHVRLVADSAAGTTFGPDLTFTTGDVPPSVSGSSAGSVTASGATISGSVNPNRVATTYRVEYGTTVAYGSQTTGVSAGSGSSAVAVSVPLSGLTSSTLYHARLVAVSAGGTTNGPDLTFTTGDLPPSVANTAAGSVTTSGATISGDVNPNRVATTYRVEYGTTVAYGSQTTAVSAGSGSSAVAVSVPLTGLTSTTTYHARLVAVSAAGTTNGPDLTFTTGDIPPSVTGTSAGSVTASGATISGSVTPNRVATTYRVEYGTTILYGSQTTGVAAGSGSSAVAASVPLTGLTSSTTYHARLVAVSAAGTTNGPDLTFTTADLPPSVANTAAGSVTTSGAAITGDVNPNGVTTTYRVEYGTTASYGSQTTGVSAGAGSSAVAVGVPLSGLTSSTLYHARLVAVSAGGTTNGPDLTFTTGDLPPSVSGTSAGSVTTSGATISGSVNPNRVATTYRVEYGTTVLYGSQTAVTAVGSGSSAVAVSVPLTGLTSSTTYHARLVAVSAGGTTNGPDLTFTTGDLPPSVGGSSAGSVTTSGATISGSVNPNRVATSYIVEYGTTAAYGSQTTGVSAGSGSSAVAVSVPLAGLTSSTTYHARLVAVSAGGTTNGPDLTFTTGDVPPSVSGSSAGSVTTSGATVSGSVNPNRVATTYRVEYGTTAAYGSQTTGVSAGSGSSAVAVSVPLTGLTSSTLYHARLVATSAGGTTNGPDLTFTTGDVPPSVTGTSAGSVTASGATISGSVNPNRVATTYVVEYGTTVSYGSQTTAVAAGSGSSGVAVSVPLTGLTSSTTYHARLVATSAGGTTNGPDLTFTTGDLPPSVTGTSAGSVTASGATISGSVNPNRVATTYRVEYGTTVAYGSQTTGVAAGSGSSGVAVSVPLTGLTSSTTYHARLVAVSAGGTTNGPDLTFTTGDVPPSVTGTSAGSVTTSGATISGDVNPNRVATTYRVEYGTTAAYGSQTTGVSAGSGSSAVAVSVPLSGLTSSTLYHARLVAVSAGGTTNGPDLTFTTGDLPPSVSGTSAGSITASGATISGSVNPNRAATTYRVEYGPTVAYGSQTTGVSAGSGSAAVAVSVPVTGLASSTSYHARLVAVSAGGTTYGPDLTFTTGGGPPPPAPTVANSAAGSVSASGATITGDIGPNGSATDYRVEYGTTAAYGSTTTWTAAGTGITAVPVSVPLSGLTSSTTYHARLVAVSAGGTTNGPDLTFTTGDVPPSVSGTSAGSVTTSGATVSGSVNPNRVATTYRVEYGTTAAYGSQTTGVSAGSGSSAVAVSVPLTGLTSSTLYHARLVATSAGGTTNGPDLTFTTGDLPPSVANSAAGSVTTSGATVSADVHPNRVATTYRVEYGATASYGSQTTGVSAGAGSSAVAVSVPLSGLSPATTYHARLVAASAGGTTNGPDLTFTTDALPPSPPPTISGSAAGSPTATGATVSGDVTPNGSATTYRVEYGTTAAYGSQTPSVSVGAGATAVAVSVPLTGLPSSTTHHARLVAQNAGGTTTGPDLIFTTTSDQQPTGGGTPPLTGGGLPTPPAVTEVPGTTTTPGTVATGATGDRVAPGLAAAFTRKAIRRGARARLRVLVSENATVALRMLDRRSRVVLRLPGARVAGGRRTVLKVSTRARRRALRRGTYRVYVTAKDAAGNATTRVVRLRLR